MAVDLPEPEGPTERDARQAREALARLARLMHSQEAVTLYIASGDQTPGELTLPPPVLRLLTTILAEMAEGNAVAIFPARAELTTQEAAQILNVSRPYLIGLLEKGEIPFRKVGAHRRVRLSDLLAYKKQSDYAQRRALDELAAQAQELNMGYD